MRDLGVKCALVVLPFDRNRLKQKNAADLEDARAAAASRSPEQGLLEVLELSELVLNLAAAAGARTEAESDLPDKVRLYVQPLRAVQRT